MSVTFGLYLVEQGVISCDQFCGLLKVQQLAVPSAASVAIRSNLLTVRQVGQVLHLIELNPGRHFADAARSLGFLGADAHQRLEHEQQRLLPTIPFLLIECGLLKPKQLETLQRAFTKATSGNGDRATLVDNAPAAFEPGVKPAEREAALSRLRVDHPDAEASRRVHATHPVPQPKFIQRPQLEQFEEAYYG